MSLASLYSFYQSIMYECILFLCLHQPVTLGADVLEEGEHVHIPSRDNLLQHGVNNNVAPGTPNTRTE